MEKIILLIMGILLLTGCNQQIVDLNKTYDYAECYLGNEYTKYEIEKWNDYEGEQIQIIAKDGKTYLLSMNYCRLVKG